MALGAVLVEQPAFQKLEGNLVYGFRVSYPVWEQSLNLRFSDWEKLHEKAAKLTNAEGKVLSSLPGFPKFADKHVFRMSFVDPKKRSQELYAWLEALVSVRGFSQCPLLKPPSKSCIPTQSSTAGAYPSILKLFGCPRDIIADVASAEEEARAIREASPRSLQPYQPSPPRALRGAATTAPPLDIDDSAPPASQGPVSPEGTEESAQGGIMLTSTEIEGPCPMDSKARALAWAEAKVAVCLRLLGKKQYDRAMSGVKYAITSMERLTLQKEPAYGKLLSVKAKCHKLMGETEESLAHFETAAKIFESKMEDHLLDWANTKRAIASLQDSLGLLHECAKSYRASREALGEALGTEHLDYGEVSLNLSCIELKMDNLDKALEACKEARRVFEAMGRGCEPQLASTLMNTAVVYKKRNKNNDAHKLLGRACKIYQEHSGENTVEYALCVYNQAMVLGSMQRLSEAAPLFEQCASIYDRVTPEGAAHPQAKAARHYLSLCGDVTEAEMPAPTYNPQGTAAEQVPARPSPRPELPELPSYEQAAASPPA